MKRKDARARGFSLVLALALAVAGSSSIARAGLPPRYSLADLKALEVAFVELADSVRPSIVAIRTYQIANRGRRGDSQILHPYSQGSGFVIGSDGYIATNRHVIEESEVISVILHNGLKYEATVVQTDVRSDLAVLKIDETHLRAVQLGDADKLKINQWVFAGGNPFGLANEDGRTSVTYGVVSAMHRQMTERLASQKDIQYYGNMLEISSTINPGNSGGPLFNIDGEVIGVVTAIETASGVSEGHGFAIPMDKNIRRILTTLKEGAVVRYGFLGVQVMDVVRPVSPLVVDSRTYRGAELLMISVADGPAALAGLKAKDIVIEYDGFPVEDSDHLVRLVGFTPVGTKVNITYLRRNVKRQTTVTVADRSDHLAPIERK